MSLSKLFGLVLFASLVTSQTAIAEGPGPQPDEALPQGDASNPLLGRWQAVERRHGSWTIFEKIAFTDESMYAQDQEGRLLRFKVKGYRIEGDRLSAFTGFGETYAFERISDRLICFEIFRMQKLEKENANRAIDPNQRHCYRRV